ncbi:MAG: hypothetical protein JOZ57_08825 [Abitibacteriaceae bacterium]|nr:hypothetical protein [Abditibacteriaceae bacterium]
MSDENKHEEEEFYIKASTPSMWLDMAEELKISADVMLRELNKVMRISNDVGNIGDIQKQKLAYMHSYMLLSGFAIEHLIKGILIADNPLLVTDKLSGDLTKHTLMQLSKNAKLSLLSDEEELLGRLEVYVVWAGRYLTAITEKKFEEQKGKRSKKHDDDQRIESLFTKLKETLTAKPNYK